MIMKLTQMTIVTQAKNTPRAAGEARDQVEAGLSRLLSKLSNAFIDFDYPSFRVQFCV